MTVQEAIKTLQKAPVEDRIHIIEMLLQSLKQDISPEPGTENGNEPFKVRTFNLGANIEIDRDEMYLTRGF